MKTVEEFYKEISESEALQEELKAASEGMLDEFLKKHGCDADAKEFTAFLSACHEGEIEDDDAAVAAGGGWRGLDYHIPDTIISQAPV